MIDLISKVPVELPSGTVLVTTAAHLRAKVREVNQKEVLNSNFYYDILRNEPYLNDEKFVIKDFQQKYPEQYEKAVKDLQAVGALKIVKTNTTFITEQGVLNILHVYGIDPVTLLKGGPKIPMVQNGLFGNKTPQTFEQTDAQRKANALFPPEEKPKRQKRIGGRRTRLHQPGVSIGNKNTPSLINLSKPLMPIIFPISYIQHQLDTGATYVMADVTVGEVDNQRLLGIKFHEDGDYEFRLRRRSSSEVGINNLSVDKRSPKPTYDKLMSLLRKNQLLDTSLTEPQIAGDTLMFEIAKPEEK